MYHEQNTHRTTFLLPVMVVHSFTILKGTAKRIKNALELEIVFNNTGKIKSNLTLLLPVIANFAGYVTNDVYVCNNMAKILNTIPLVWKTGLDNHRMKLYHTVN